MASHTKGPHPLRLAIFEGLQNIDDLSENFNGNLGIEEAFVLIPSVLDFEDIVKEQSESLWLKDPRIEWIVGASPEELPNRFYHALIRRNRHFIMKASGFIPSSQSQSKAMYFEAARNKFSEICELIELGRGYLASSLIAIENTIDNLDLIESNPGIDLLHGALGGRPAVIVSTGPSLPASLKLLKQIQDRCVIIAADASLNILLKEGITPHIVCTIEREEGTKRFYQTSFKDFSGVEPHIVTFSIAPRTVINEMKGPLWFAYRNISFFGFFESQLPRGILPSGHSVAHFCARLAKHLGCSEIVLIGQDLSYDPDHFASHSFGFTYSEMTQKSSLEALREKIEARGEKLLYVNGNCRELVPTSTYYLLFLREFESLVSDIGIPVKNATVGGAKIQGVQWGTLEEFSSHWKTLKSPIDILNKIRANFTPAGRFDPDQFLRLCDEPLGLIQQCSEILTRHINHLHDLNTESVLITVAQQMRAVQRQLLEHEIFRALTLDLIGTRFVQIENAIALIWENDTQSLPKRLGLLVEWFSECRNAIVELKSLFNRRDIKNSRPMASRREE